jgi:hypothetical protein
VIKFVQDKPTRIDIARQAAAIICRIVQPPILMFFIQVR